MGKMDKVIDFIFEARLLRQLRRSGTDVFLGGPIQQSVAEHIFVSSMIALIMTYLDKSANKEKVLSLSLTHDLEEVRTGDLNKVNRLYIDENEQFNAFQDLIEPLEFKDELTKLYQERRENKSKEAQYARDADILAEMILEKENFDAGYRYAKEWLEFTYKRLTTGLGKQLGKTIMASDSHRWFQNLKNQIRRHHGVKEKDYSKS